MSIAFQRLAEPTLRRRLRNAPTTTRPLMLDVIAQACARIRAPRCSEQAQRIALLIDVEAWTDAALALIPCELPMWQVRRIAYDAGEWHCALSRDRDLPDWLDGAAEAHHADLALALLSVLLDVKALAAEASRPSVPVVRPASTPFYEPIGCENVR